MLLRTQKTTFAKYLGVEFSPETFLTKVENTRTLMPHLDNNEILLGLVLGYGLESALKFQELQKCSHDSHETEACHAIISHQPKGCKIEPVVFIGDPQSIEVQNIREHFGDPIAKIWDVYKDKRFLIAVIKALCAP